MRILSENEFYSMGIESILARLAEGASQPAGPLPVHFYITSGVSFVNINRWIARFPPDTNSIFICNDRVKGYLIRRYNGKIKYFIDEDASVEDALKVIQGVVSRCRRNKKGKTIPHRVRLTPKQQVIITLTLLGYNLNFIALHCNIDVKTIYSHRNVVMRKTGMNNIQEFYYLMKGAVL